MASVREMSTENGIDLRFEVAEELLPVNVDPDRMQQILRNVLGNALKFTPEGGRIAVFVKRDGDHGTVTIQDTGHGIGPEFLPFVFDMFRQDEGHDRRRGLGIGLASSDSWTCTAEKSPSPAGVGRGTRWDSAATGPGGPRRRQPSFTEAIVDSDQKPLAGLRINVVDDTDDVREAIAAMLEELGAQVHGASDGAEELEARGATVWTSCCATSSCRCWMASAGKDFMLQVTDTTSDCHYRARQEPARSGHGGGGFSRTSRQAAKNGIWSSRSSAIAPRRLRLLARPKSRSLARAASTLGTTDPATVLRIPRAPLGNRRHFGRIRRDNCHSVARNPLPATFRLIRDTSAGSAGIRDEPPTFWIDPPTSFAHSAANPLPATFRLVPATFGRDPVTSRSEAQASTRTANRRDSLSSFDDTGNPQIEHDSAWNDLSNERSASEDFQIRARRRRFAQSRRLYESPVA